MTNPNEEPTNHPNTNDIEETTNARPATDSEVAYRDGYTSGRIVENDLQHQKQARIEERSIERDNENAARGLLLGIIAASAVALAIGAVVFASYLNREDDTTAPTIIKVPSADKEESPQTPEKETTIIERTVETVPVPQEELSPSPAPNVEVNTPAPKVEVNTPPPEVEINVPAPSNSAPANTQTQPEPSPNNGSQNSTQEPPSGNAESSEPTTP